jgi:PAS domain S-box-containing protein
MHTDRKNTDRATPKPLERKIAAAFATAVIMLVLTGVVATHNVNSYLASKRQNEQSWAVTLQATQTLSCLQEVQAARRRFIITGEQQYLDAFHAAVAVARDQLQKLQDLSPDSPDQIRQIESLYQLAASALAAADQSVSLARAHRLDAASARIGGQPLLDQVHSAVKQMQDDATIQMKDRSAREYSSARKTIVIIYCACGFSFLFVMTAGWTIKRDIAARRRAEEERDRFFNISLDMLATAGFDGYFKSVNPAFTRVLGWSEEELLSQPWRAFVHPDDVDATLQEHQKQLTTGALTIEFENRYRCKDGSYRWLSWAAIPVAQEQKVYAAARDSTDRKRAEVRIHNLNRELTHHAADLETTTRELEAFSYSVSHDLRAPLRGIDGFSQTLLEDHAHALDDEAKDCLNRIRAAAQRMGQLIDDMLSLSQISRSELRHEQTDLADAARAIVAQLQSEQPDRNVEVVIPPALAAWGDPRLLRIALDNLLGNAWKFTAKSENPRIEIGQTQDQDETIYFVRDNGAGFDMAYAGKLFGAFQRLHSVAEFAGTGIGLATVQRIIHRHGGRIWANAQVGKGATFLFTLPRPANTLPQAA